MKCLKGPTVDVLGKGIKKFVQQIANILYEKQKEKVPKEAEPGPPTKPDPNHDPHNNNPDHSNLTAEFQTISFTNLNHMAVGKVSGDPKGGGEEYGSKINVSSITPNMSVVAGEISTLTKIYQVTNNYRSIEYRTRDRFRSSFGL